MWDDSPRSAERRRFIFVGILLIGAAVAMGLFGDPTLLFFFGPAGCFGAYLIIKMAREIRRDQRIRRAGNRRAEGRCPACGYDLRHKPEKCPECGADPKNIDVKFV